MVATERDASDAAAVATSPAGHVLDGVTSYHWLVVVVAACGWLFDCMDQRLFALCRGPALKDILGSGATDATVKAWGGWATAIMMMGWATGGLVFGTLSDRLGRKKTMVVTLLVYSGFTGLSGLARDPVEFMSYRFLTGIGIGGMFGAATTLVAESVPSGFRSIALGVLQTLSALGNLMGSVVSTQIQPGRAALWFGWAGWRVLFFVGLLPAALVVPMMLVLREPEAWRLAKQSGKRKVGSVADLFRIARWRNNLFVGLALGLSGMAGLWGIGFFSPELISTALAGEPANVVDAVRGWGTAMQDIGSFCGMLTFTFAATYLGRRVAFLGAFALCLVTTIFVFNRLRTGADAYWMLPLMGFAQLSVFGGYSIYFPELFPTRLRGTGVGFCYNTVRYLAAAFPVMLVSLNQALAARGAAEPFRRSATILSFVFLLGMLALLRAPETRGQPLPED
jgi:MFS family permease